MYVHDSDSILCAATRIKCSQWVSMTSSQDIPVGDPFHLVRLEVNCIGTYAGNKSGEVKMKALQGRQSTSTLPQEGCRNYTLIRSYLLQIL